MTMDTLFANIYQHLPEFKDKLHFSIVQYDETKNRAVFFFNADVLVENGSFGVIRKVLQKAFPKLSVSLRVASPSLGGDFMADPAKYAPVFDHMLQRQLPGISPWLKSLGWKCENGALVLEVPDDLAMEYMSDNEIARKLSVMLDDVFRIKPPVHLRLSKDLEKRMERLERLRADEEAILSLTAEDVTGDAPPEKPKARVKKKGRKILGSVIAAEPVPIKGLTEVSGKVTIAGKVIDVTTRPIQNGNATLLTFVLSDFTDSILCKVFLGTKPPNGFRGDAFQDPEKDRQKMNEVISRVKPGDGLKVRGYCQMDSYDRALVIMAQDIGEHALEVRGDKAPEKRVELHAHTTMSFMDGVVSPTELIKRAADFGHPAIAITDEGVVQAFPEAFAAANKHKVKLIPGMIGMMVDDTGIIQPASSAGLDEPIIVLDFETTGLNPYSDRIIEIGAVKLAGGQILDSFSTLVNPGVPLSQEIINITGIKDAMLIDAPKAGKALEGLTAFAGDSPLAAHNARFDMSFLRAELARLGKTFDSPQLDTLAFAQRLYPQLRSYRLSALCKALGVQLKNAHRAVQDATATAQCLARMLEDAGEKGVSTLDELNTKITGYSRTTQFPVTILAKSQKGLENLNRLVTESHINYFHHHPTLPRKLLEKHRDGLLLGTSCYRGELFQAVLDRKPQEELEESARFYDFIEIQPEQNSDMLLKRGRLGEIGQVRKINQTLVSLGEKLGIPVAATGDVRFLDPEDAIFRTIIKNSIDAEAKYSDEQPPLYFKTTEEMLEDFAWLGEKKAREVVVDNPLKILAQVGDITLYPKHPENKTTFAPVWDSAPEDIRKMTEAQARAFYGDGPPALIRERIDKELKAIIGYGYSTLYLIANKLVSKSNQDGYMVGSRGSVGSSFVATMCGITEVNPLPPHYRCPDCRTSDFEVDREACQTGVDLPDRECPNCGMPLVKDGYDIPFEVFLGFKGDKVPDIDLNFCSDYQAVAHAYMEELFGKGHVFRAGTIGTLQDKTAYGYVMKYLEDRELSVSNAEKTRLAMGCIGVKRTTGQHPGGMVILPKGYDINQFTAVQYPANDDKKPMTTHFDFRSMHDILVKVDVLGHDDPTMIRMMEGLAGIKHTDIPLDDKKVLSLFTSPDALGLSQEELECTTGTLGIPEFGTPFVRGILDDTKPASISDLIRISGLSHGTDVWSGNARDLILGKTATLKECICTRDDIMLALMDRGLPTKAAFDIMESVRKGNGLTAEMEQIMREHKVQDWFIDSCKKIAYMFPKGHAVAYVTMALRVGWFKVYHPLVYYAAYFTIRGSGFSALTMTKPPEYIKKELHNLKSIEQRDLTEKNKEEIVVMEMVYEMGLRGFSFLPVDLYKSHESHFLIEGDALRCPFTSLPSFGIAAAQNLVAAREEPFISVEDLKTRARLSVAVINMLRDMGTLNGLSDTNQVDFFSLL
ncbi:MAG: PolC-type DNA polymerase III [Eubacteriales bacterium]|nr:PolC-type DNA polymerase III [Eubacteriales bacterium]